VERLRQEVTRRLRNRLVRFIARAVAHHLQRTPPPGTKEADHA
jgi:hypothetical protein